MFAIDVISQTTKIETLVQKGHIQPVAEVAYHPSGDYFITGGMDNAIILWDVASGQQIRSFNIHTNRVNNLDFSLDGTLLLSAGMDNFIYVTDILTGEIKEKYVHKNKDSYPMSVRFSTTNKFIIVGDNRDRIFLINRTDQSMIQLNKGFSASISSLSMSPNEQVKMDLVDYNKIAIINSSKKDTIELPFDKANNISFSPNGKHVAIGSTKLYASIIDIETGKVVQEIIPNPENQCDGCNIQIAYSPNGLLFLTHDTYNGLVVWNTSNWKKVFQLTFKEERFETIQFSDDNNSILLSNGSQCQIVNVASKKVVFEFKNDLMSNFTPSISPDGQYILLPDLYNSVSSYKINSQKVAQKYRGYLNTEAAINSKYNYAYWRDINVLNLMKFKNPIEISPDGSILAQGKIENTIVLFDLVVGKQKMVLKGHEHQVLSLAFHPDGKELVSGDAGGEVIIWDLTTGLLKKKFMAHSNVVLFDLAYNSSGTELITAGWDAYIKHWDLSNYTQLGYIDLENKAAFSIQFSPNDLYILIGDNDQSVYYYEVDTKRLVRTLIGHTKTITQSYVDQKSTTLITSSNDGSVRFWDFYSGILKDKVTTPFNAGILSLAKHASLPILFFGSADRKIYVYDLEKKAFVSSFLAHQSGVCELKIHPTQPILYSRSVEGEVKVWNLNTYEEQLTLMYMNQNDWLITQPNGYFDGTSNAMKSINYVTGLKTLEVGSFFKKYYYPGLYDYLNKGNRFVDGQQGMNTLMEKVPSFEIQFANFQGKVTSVNADSTYKHNSSSVVVDIMINNTIKNIDKINVYNNGKIIKQEAFEEEVSFRGTANKRTTTIQLAPKKNQLEFTLTTKEGITTPSKSLQLFYDTLTGKTDLFIVALGINEYQNPSYNLKYAKNDAVEFSNVLSNCSATLFSKVYSYTLADKEVTRANVYKIIASIKSQMGPEDVFVFYYAGHGMMVENIANKSNDFYLIMSDITNLYGDKAMLDAKGISSQDLLEISRVLSAQKQVFVLDACQSGAALNALAVRGVEREKALAQLARNSGTFFLTASQDVEFANEVGELKHGLFTYAILEILNGTKGVSKPNETISIYQLKSYVETRVPELSKEHQGSSQYPTGYSFGNDFPIGVVLENK